MCKNDIVPLIPVCIRLYFLVILKFAIVLVGRKLQKGSQEIIWD